MTEVQKELWEKIKEFEFDEPGSVLTFTGRLASENGWTLQYALRTVEEYKKFMFLLCNAPHPLTPSDQVDQVWHLHLIYTQSYWRDFCPNVLGRDVHHGPTAGGTSEKQKFTDWYEATKKLYAEMFAEDPPPDIWPESSVRFGEINFLRVNLDRSWIIKKPGFLRKGKEKKPK